MIVIRKLKQIYSSCQKYKNAGKRIGFVATMGTLHPGHLSLIKKARKENDIVIVSIFVNPSQFAPSEDFKKYPRNLKKDIVLCKKEGADIIFAPEAKEMYPAGYRTFVDVSELSQCLCGKSRPMHFRGVATVVLKLFNLVQPDTAYFGQKDAQQAVIIKKMVADLNVPVLIKVMPIVREGDGLAMSSRNRYLSPEERDEAVVLSRALKEAKMMIKQGERNTDIIIQRMRGIIMRKKIAKIDYISIVYLDGLNMVSAISDKCLIALAVHIGKTRLIDNAIIDLKKNG
ncbi:MAG: pantoate--beta-alanine ligase [Candidatus Omnitrophica bacterium]|jgi:pantoate--beta-alanine ligase|nr:pantoate--beta-alanine ligase [Candidatus Omnitrophota bacterium]